MNNFIDKLENKKGLIIIGIFLLVLSIASGTFAFWNWASSDTEKTDVVIEVPDVCIVSVDGGGVFNASDVNIVPTTCTNSNNAIIKEITVNVQLVPEEGAATTVSLWLTKEALSSGTYLETTNFKYALTTSPTSCTSDVVASGTFSGVSVGSDIELLKKVYTYESVQNITETFYLYIWLDAAETDISTAGKNFNIVMDADCSNFEEIITLSYDLNGGSGDFSSQTLDYDGQTAPTYTLPTIEPTKSGETFLGWSTSDDGTVEYNPGDTIALTKSTELYALWRVDDVDVTYVANLVTDITDNTDNGVTATYAESTSYLTLNGTQSATSRVLGYFNSTSFVEGEEYKFTLTHVSGSYTTTASTYNMAFDIRKSDKTAMTSRNYKNIQYPTSGSKSETLTVNSVGASEGGILQLWMWVSEASAITFDNYVVKVEVTKVNTVTSIYGENYVLPSNPVRDGYTFTGWYTAETGGTQVTSSTVVNSIVAHNIYAQWRQNKVYINYHVNGGSIATASNDNGTWTTTNSLVYQNGTIFATSINYGATIGSSGLTNYNNSSWLNISRTGYSTTSGEEWICHSGCTTANKVFSQSATTYTPDDFCDASSSDCTVVLKVNWKLNSYTISYDACSGSGAPSSQTKTHGTALTLSSTTPTRTGYTFEGWSTAASCSAATSVNYAAGASYTTNASDTLYAVWEPVSYTISYNACSGTGAPSSQTKTHGTALTLSSTKPTRNGYTFAGWSTAASCSAATSVNYAAGASYTTNASDTLYAVWTAASATTYKIANLTETFFTGGSNNGGNAWIGNSADAACNANYNYVGRYAFKTPAAGVRSVSLKLTISAVSSGTINSNSFYWYVTTSTSSTYTNANSTSPTNYGKLSYSSLTFTGSKSGISLAGNTTYYLYIWNNCSYAKGWAKIYYTGGSADITITVNG